MPADLVWTTGGDQAKTFHRIDRHTPCGKFTGFSGGEVSEGQLLTRDEAVAAGLTECRRCFGHSERRQPFIEGRPNRG